VSILCDFAATHALVTTEDADAFLRSRGPHHPRARDRALAALCASGTLVRVQRGVYARPHPEADAADPNFVASRLAPDAILGLHSALEVRGIVAPSLARCVYFTRLAGSARGPVWRGRRLHRISHPVALEQAGRKLLETDMVEGHRGVRMRATTIERAFVDVLDRPRLIGDWPSVIQVLDAIAVLDLDRVVHYVGCLRNATTAAKVGWHLERRQQRLSVTPGILCRLEHMRPRGPHYLSRSQRVGGRYIARWNLVVPPSL
jgi:predicted transcriptional regulator of viral defense system